MGEGNVREGTSPIVYTQVTDEFLPTKSEKSLSCRSPQTISSLTKLLIVSTVHDIPSASVTNTSMV